MRFAFAIVSLFPGGGLQRDCIDIARRVRGLGHEVTIFTSRKSGEGFADDLPMRILSVGGYTNHYRQRAFSDEFRKAASAGFDLLVGFDKLGGLDVLYCSDRSMRARATASPLLLLLPRYREYIDLEQECFGPDRKTKILVLSETQRNEYWSAWATEPKRLFMLPPPLVPARRRPELRTNGARDEWRTRLGLSPIDYVWIAVGIQPNTKGIDRSIRALQKFPPARLLIVGLHGEETRSTRMRQLARRLGVDHQITWLGHREDVPELMAAADVFVHPARYDTTGTVILEAIVNGLPVITTSACGYAKHVSSADAGIVVQEPFHQRSLISALETARDPAYVKHWSKSGSQYGRQRSLYEGRNRAAELIVASAETLDLDATSPHLDRFGRPAITADACQPDIAQDRRPPFRGSVAPKSLLHASAVSRSPWQG
jgi:UDP-glucose:(heptosyl)LPS alpha-1,3-glucosyltransferase